MKSTAYITGLTALALAVSASAADTIINITGATAFRSATLTAIKAKFDAGNGTVSYKYAHDKAAGSLTSSKRSIFVGNFPGVTGTTTIRCCFTGSVEGIRALNMTGSLDPSPPTYYPAAQLSTTTAGSPGVEVANPTPVSPGLETLTTTSDAAFSDVNVTSTPFPGSLATNDKVGVIVFTMMTNEGSTITNVTSQQYRALLSKGQPLSLFDGNAAHTTKVYAIGRNDGSGTRTTALAEAGYGVTTTVNQYVSIANDGTALTTLQKVPATGINSANGQAVTGQLASNASTVWGQDVAGNGGYDSGSNVATDLGLTTSNVAVYDETGVLVTTGPINLVSWLGISDAKTAKTNGGLLCGFNGQSLDLLGASSSLSDADKDKISKGVYTAWGYERMFRTSSTTGDKKTVYDAIKAAIPANIGTAGLPIGVVGSFAGMKVSRSSDGGLVAP